MPKRPRTAYFVFMEEFRKVYKEEHPEVKGLNEFAKKAGAKWKALTDQKKKPYQDKAADLKTEYEKAMEFYNADNGVRKNNVDYYEGNEMSDKVDRISNLPNDILVYLLSFMEMKTAGRTSLLSRRWRYVWSHSTGLDFEDKELFLQRKKIDSIKTERFIKWVNQVLISHRAPSLNTLRIHYPLYGSYIADNIVKWVKLALRKNVGNLELNLANVNGFPQIDPKRSGDINICPIFRHHYGTTLKSFHLISLHLEAVFIEGPVLENILSNCLNVERLTMRACHFCSVISGNYRPICKKIVVSSLKLKYLEFCRCSVDSVQISAPQLTSFALVVECKAEVEYTNVPSLLDVTFISAYCFHISHNLNVFSNFSHRLKKLSLYWNRVSYAVVGFPNLHIDNLLILTSLIEACPLLHGFKLEVEGWRLQGVPVSGVKDAKNNHVMRAHEHLKVVEFVGFDGSASIAELAICLTQHAQVLKKIILDPRCSQLSGGYIHIMCDIENVDGREYARRQAKLLAKRFRGGIDVVIP